MGGARAGAYSSRTYSDLSDKSRPSWLKDCKVAYLQGGNDFPGAVVIARCPNSITWSTLKHADQERTTVTLEGK